MPLLYPLVSVAPACSDDGNSVPFLATLSNEVNTLASIKITIALGAVVCDQISIVSASIQTPFEEARISSDDGLYPKPIGLFRQTSAPDDADVPSLPIRMNRMASAPEYEVKRSLGEYEIGSRSADSDLIAPTSSDRREIIEWSLPYDVCSVISTTQVNILTSNVCSLELPFPPVLGKLEQASVLSFSILWGK